MVNHSLGIGVGGDYKGAAQDTFWGVELYCMVLW